MTLPGPADLTTIQRHIFFSLLLFAVCTAPAEQVALLAIAQPAPSSFGEGELATRHTIRHESQRDQRRVVRRITIRPTVIAAHAETLSVPGECAVPAAFTRAHSFASHPLTFCQLRLPPPC